MRHSGYDPRKGHGLNSKNTQESILADRLVILVIVVCALLVILFS